MIKLFCAGLLALQLAPAARAQTTPDGDTLVWGGFATLGVARSSSDAARFVRYDQNKGVGTRPDPGLDSILGLQASYRFSPTLSATAQATLSRAIGNNLEPDLSWAFVRARLNDNVTLRVGRIGLPGLLMAEIQNVGYAYTVMRPPVELYSQAGIDHIDGGDLAWQRTVGDSVWTVALSAGGNHSRTAPSNGGDSVGHTSVRLQSLGVTLERGPLTVRLTHGRSRVSLPDLPELAALQGTLAQAGFGPLAQQMTLRDGKRIRFESVALQYDASHLFVAAEYGHRHRVDPSYIPDTNAGYVTAGWRIGPLLPYYSHARLRRGGAAVALPQGFPVSGALAAAVRDGLLRGPEQFTHTLGLRWNVAPSRALTVQLDRVRPTAKNGTLVGGPPDGLHRAVTVLGVAFDVVF